MMGADTWTVFGTEAVVIPLEIKRVQTSVLPLCIGIIPKHRHYDGPKAAQK